MQVNRPAWDLRSCCSALLIESRARHIRCDEKKPQCLNCIKSRRICDFGVSSNPHLAPWPYNQIERPPSFPSVIQTQNQKDTFDFYVRSSLADGLLPVAEFYSLVPQIAVANTGVMELCCGIGDLHQSIILGVASSDEHRAALVRSLECYGRAAAIARQRNTDMFNLVVTSILFVTYDMTLNDLAAAKKHLILALKIFAQQSANTKQPSNAERAVANMLRRMMAHPQLSGTALEEALIPSSSMEGMPSAFNDAETASAWWDLALHIAIRSTQGFTRAADELAFEALFRWHARFLPLLQQARDQRGAILLKVYVLESIYLEVMAELHALDGQPAAMLPGMKEMHVDMVNGVEEMMEASPPGAGVEPLLYNKWIRLLVFVLRQTSDADVWAAAKRALAQIEGGGAVLDTFAMKDAVDQPMVNNIYEGVAEWHFMTIGCSPGIPRRPSSLVKG